MQTTAPAQQPREKPLPLDRLLQERAHRPQAAAVRATNGPIDTDRAVHNGSRDTREPGFMGIYRHSSKWLKSRLHYKTSCIQERRRLTTFLLGSCALFEIVK